MVQINPTVGDIDSNLNNIKDVVKKAAGENTDLVVFPELSLIGYPPRDLLHKKQVSSSINMAIEDLIDFSNEYPEMGIIIGAPVETKKKIGKGLYNSALLISNGELLHRQDKSLLPTYDVFDETRYFDSAENIEPITFKGEKLGITICEDIWNDPDLWENRHYDIEPVDILINKAATIIINISASPFQCDKYRLRSGILKNFVKKYKVPFIYVNQIGGNDELIFDGQSIAIGERGILGKLAAFKEDLLTVDTKKSDGENSKSQTKTIRVANLEMDSLAKDQLEESNISNTEPEQSDLELTKSEEICLGKIEGVHQALVLGIKDYFKKCGFSKAVVGLSGGIDSAVTLCLAVEALGSENVLAISMPSKYSSKGSVEDSRLLAKNLDIDFKVISIEGVYDSYINTLDEHFTDLPEDVTEENIQARTRGNILMAFSNKFGFLVLATGNKSELAVGYCTLYGDMSGGMSVLSDVPKTMVYELAEKINVYKEIIPEEIIEKAPSAELRPDQKDEDSLPPYDVLDKILYYYIDENMSLKEIVAKGYEEDLVHWIIKKVDNNEYKRRQAAPGLKVTTKAFGMGRRMPVAARIEY